jgi:hypothetical protein
VLEDQPGGDIREERRRGEGVAHLLHEDHQLHDPQALAALVLGDEDSRPAELRHLPPQVDVVLTRLGELPDPLQLEAVGQELAGGGFDCLLVVREVEIHQLTVDS